MNIYVDYCVDKDECATNNSLTMAKKGVLKSLVKRLSDKTNADNPLRTMSRFYVRIPLCCLHLSHPVGGSATMGQYVDKRILDKIYELASHNVTNVAEVKRCLDRYVENEVFGGVAGAKKPKKTNRRYYPSRKDLRNHIARAISAQKYCDDDQESLRLKIRDWQERSPQTRFFYRTRDDPPASSDPAGKNSSEESAFLFVHQEPWQQRLLQRYGSQLVLMDATYKTTMYAIPLFFICVHTNVGYTVVAEFMCQTEDETSISEALAILRKWNPAWNPDYFMVDYSSAEISAIEKRFPESTVYNCDFHRIQALQRWSRAKKNNLSSAEQEMFLGLMQHITYARTEEGYKKGVEALRKSRVYKDHANLQTYVENTWLSCSFRWAQAFRKQQAINIVNTNNGTEAQNKLFKYGYLPTSIDKSVYGIAIMLVESFIPDSYQHYLQSNLKSSSAYGRFSHTVPDYLHNRPPRFVKHCLSSRFAAAEYQATDVSPVNFWKGEFHVKFSSKSNQNHLVNFSTPSCSCADWRKTQYPCKHFFAVFATYEEWDFNSLPVNYRNSVFITLDTEHLAINTPPVNSATTEDANVPDAKNTDNHAHCKSQDESSSDEETERDDLCPTNMCAEASEQAFEAQKEDRPSQSASLRKVLQAELNAVKDVSFLVDDDGILAKGVEEIRNVHDMLLKSCPKRNGLPLRNSPMKKKLKPNRVEYHQVFHKKLPKRRKWKKKTSFPKVIIDEDGNAEEKKEVSIRHCNFVTVAEKCVN